MKKFNVVGKPVTRQDAYEKATGTALYADDYTFPGMLYGVMVRVPASHAIIDRIDYSAVAGNPAVTAIVDHNDIPAQKKVGPIKQDQPIFSWEKIVTPGDVVAMLVGQNETELLQLRDKVSVEFTALPVLTDPLKSMDPDAPRIHPQYENNAIVHYPLRKGDPEKGFAESDYIIEQTYTTQFIEHGYIEPEAVIAIPLGKAKGVKILGSIQNPHTTRKVVALVLGLPLTKVRVVQAEMGGSFGGKDDQMNILSARAAVAAVKTNRPVKIRFNREESILESYKRHPYHMHYKVGFTNEGKLKSMRIHITADGGAYASMSPFVTWRTVVQATGPYEVENVFTDVHAVYTNNPYTGAMRGFGSPQPIFAQEQIMDEIALKLGMSPLQIREINGFKTGSVTASGQKLDNHEVNLSTVINKAVEETNFVEKWQKNQKDNADVAKQLNFANDSEANQFILTKDQLIAPDKTWRKGIGLAASYRGCSLGAEGIDVTSAYLSVQLDGSAYLLCGLAENGQGLRTTFCIVAAEILGLTVDKIFYLEQDTAIAPDSGPTVASRSTLMGGGAVRNAAETIRERMVRSVADEWKVSADSITFANNTVSSSENNKSVTFADACGITYKHKENLATIGFYQAPEVSWEEETGQGSAYFTYVYGCQIAEITVNIATGQVYVEKVTAVHDPGTVLNLQGALGQVYGGVTQGVGYGIWEEISVHNGKIREMNLDQYLLPTSKEIDDITAIFIEGKDEHGAWGAKSLGEPTLELGAAAVANAIQNATGTRFYHNPINLEEILLNRKLYPEDLKRGSL
ncbi:MAG: xanthine dehydrogenase family protein molybdopterin-binding subunit [Ignavibacteria bacterium]|nr:xanthine dehydrogenase family protein molybdopterin-binding subunit [Ignavibacteria bacterium]